MSAFDAEARRQALRKFIAMRGLKVAPWAKKAGISEGTVRNFLTGATHSLTDQTIQKLAAAADADPADLFNPNPVPAGRPVKPALDAFAQHFPAASPAPTAAAPMASDSHLLPVGLRPVMVRGEVEAGSWREAAEWPQSEWFVVPAPATGRYAHLPQFGLVVRGPSMNLLYPEGSIIICVRLIDLQRRPNNGERVVVEAHRAGLTEATVKEYREEDGKAWLVPRSSSPGHQKPIELPARAFEWGLAEKTSTFTHEHQLSDSTDEITVTALVVASFRPEN